MSDLSITGRTVFFPFQQPIIMFFGLRDACITPKQQHHVLMFSAGWSVGEELGRCLARQGRAGVSFWGSGG